MKLINRGILVTAMLSICILTGCSSFPNGDLSKGNTVSYDQAKNINDVVIGRVLSITPVKIKSNARVADNTAQFTTTAIGAGLGSLAGGGMGHIAGAVLGGVLGNAVGHAYETNPDYIEGNEYLVSIHGRLVSVIQGNDTSVFKKGDLVQVVINNNGSYQLFPIQ